jgi:hypothetical protein
LQWNRPNIFQAKFFPKITKHFQPFLICFHCTSDLSNKKYFRLEMMFRNYVGVSTGCWSLLGATSPNRLIWKRDKASAIMLIDPSMCTALICILLRNVHNTNGRSNFITDFDLEVLLFIIVTNAIVSTLNNILLFV